MPGYPATAGRTSAPGMCWHPVKGCGLRGPQSKVAPRIMFALFVLDKTGRPGFVRDVFSAVRHPAGRMDRPAFLSKGGIFMSEQSERKRVILSGIQPTGTFTLGNYIARSATGQAAGPVRLPVYGGRPPRPDRPAGACGPPPPHPRGRGHAAGRRHRPGPEHPLCPEPCPGPHPAELDFVLQRPVRRAEPDDSVQGQERQAPRPTSTAACSPIRP